MRMLWDGFRDRVERLRHLDPHCAAFGAESQRYRFGKHVTEYEIKRFEERARIEMPEELRQYYRELGDGGAGPGYGIFSMELLEWADDAETLQGVDGLPEKAVELIREQTADLSKVALI